MRDVEHRELFCLFNARSWRPGRVSRTTFGGVRKVEEGQNWGGSTYLRRVHSLVARLVGRIEAMRWLESAVLAGRRSDNRDSESGHPLAVTVRQAGELEIATSTSTSENLSPNNTSGGRSAPIVCREGHKLEISVQRHYVTQTSSGNYLFWNYPHALCFHSSSRDPSSTIHVKLACGFFGD